MFHHSQKKFFLLFITLQCPLGRHLEGSLSIFKIFFKLFPFFLQIFSEKKKPLIKVFLGCQTFCQRKKCTESLTDGPSYFLPENFSFFYNFVSCVAVFVAENGNLRFFTILFILNTKFMKRKKKKLLVTVRPRFLK